MACADEGSEQRKVNRGTENIGMNLFPPSFISDIVVTIFVVSSAEASIILSQGSHENHGYQANQENNHHEGIKYREPVYLRLGGLVTIIEKRNAACCISTWCSKKLLSRYFLNLSSKGVLVFCHVTE